VGDVRSGSVKRVASAVGEGAMAVRLIHQYLRGSTVPWQRPGSRPKGAPPSPSTLPQSEPDRFSDEDDVNSVRVLLVDLQDLSDPTVLSIGGVSAGVL
jgi:hypothetical protein